MYSFVLLLSSYIHKISYSNYVLNSDVNMYACYFLISVHIDNY